MAKKLVFVAVGHIDIEAIRQAVAETGQNIDVVRFGKDQFDFEDENIVYLCVLGKLGKAQLGTLLGPTLLRNSRPEPIILTHMVSDLVDYGPFELSEAKGSEFITTDPSDIQGEKLINEGDPLRITDFPRSAEPGWLTDFVRAPWHVDISPYPLDIPPEEPRGPTDLGKLPEESGGKDSS